MQRFGVCCQESTKCVTLGERGQDNGGRARQLLYRKYLNHLILQILI